MNAVTEETRRLLGAIVQFAHALDLQVIAEDIENSTQRDLLRALDYGSRYGWSFQDIDVTGGKSSTGSSKAAPRLGHL